MFEYVVVLKSGYTKPVIYHAKRRFDFATARGLSHLHYTKILCAAKQPSFINAMTSAYLLLSSIIISITGLSILNKDLNYSTMYLSSIFQEPDKSCPLNSFKYQGSCYILQTSKPVNWSQGVSYCNNVSYGSSPVIFSDVNEYSSVRKYFSQQLLYQKSHKTSEVKQISFYVGLSHDHLSGEWKWLDGKRLSSTKLSQYWWPSRLPYSHCGLMIIYENGISHLTNCHCDEAKPFLCKLAHGYCYSKYQCGLLGKCLNDKSSTFCYCGYFRTGLSCEHWSNKGIQAIIAIILSFTIMTIHSILQGRYSQISNILFPRNSKAKLIRRHTFNLITLSKTATLRNEVYKKQGSRYASYQGIILYGEIILSLMLTVITLALLKYISIQNNQLQFNRTFDFLFGRNQRKSIPIFRQRWILVLFSSSLFTIHKLTQCTSTTYNYCNNCKSSANEIGKKIKIIYILTSYEIFNALKQTISIWHKSNSGILVEFARQTGMVVLLGMRYYPLLTSIRQISSGSANKLILTGATCIYLWMNVTAFIIWEFTTHYNLTLHYYRYVRISPFIFCIYLLTISETNRYIFCLYKAILKFGRKKGIYDEIISTTWSQHSITCNCGYAYVQELLKRVVIMDADENQPLRRIKRYFSYLLKSIPDAVINTYIVGFFIIFQMCVSLFEASHTIDNIFSDQYNRLRVHVFDLNSKFQHTNRTLNLASNLSISFDFRISIALSFLLSCTHIIYAILGYERQMQITVKGNHPFKYNKHKKKSSWQSGISHRSHWILANNFHFLGLVLAHLIWAFVISFICMFLVISSLHHTFSYAPFVTVDIIWTISCPIILLLIIKDFLVFLVARLYFIQPYNSNPLGTYSSPAIKNVNWMSIFMYFNFFLDCFSGAMICLIRIFKNIFLIFLFLGRIDRSLVSFDNYIVDRGYSSFLCFIYVQHLTSNPISKFFCELMLTSSTKAVPFAVNDDDKSSTLTILKWKRRKTTARTRWFLIYTLVHNRKLIKDRVSQLT
ncbi:hypothetical protein GJ496_009655 [Pomphorhynchus laevis]|nr:hypothetical protein GJ496_009655 [Pomphorhynchus laevis]